MMTNLLAVAAPVAGGEVNIITTGAIAAVCSMVSGLVLYGKGKQSRQVTIDKQPVGVKVEEPYVTRSEFAEFKGEVKADVREMRGSVDRLVLLIDERDKALTLHINNVASGAYEARRRIHETTRVQGEQIAVLADRHQISKGLGSLGKAIMVAIGKPKEPI